MRASSTLAALALGLALGSAQNVYRRAETPFDAVTLTAPQHRRIDAITARFTPRLSALQKAERNGEDVDERRDALNREYSKALLSVMDRAQKTAYLEAVYRHVGDFLATHPKVTFEQVFVWGGAYAKRASSRP